MHSLWLVALGGAIGAVARAMLSTAILSRWPSTLPSPMFNRSHWAKLRADPPMPPAACIVLSTLMTGDSIHVSPSQRSPMATLPYA